MINSLTDGLISFWELDEVSGARNDSHGTRHLTDNATVTSNAGIGGMGTAAEFTRANSEYLSHADHTDLEPGDADFTFTAWVFLVTGYGNYPFILSKDLSTPNRSYFLRYVASTTNRFDFGVYSDGTAGNIAVANNFGAASNDTWYFVVAHYDAAANLISISINDGTPNTAAQTGGAFNNASEFRIGNIGSADSNARWNGRIDQVGFWKRKLLPEEITWLYNGGEGRSYAEMSESVLPMRRLLGRRAAAAGGFQAAWARGANTVLGVRGGP